jgi:hypothetical protein
VPTKIYPSDWDRLFAPNAPRRGGPLRALINVLITALVLILIGGAAVYLTRYRSQQLANAITAATTLAATNQPLATQTAAALLQVRQRATATREAQLTATVQAGQPGPALGVGTVERGGNLRKEPRVAPDTVVGLIWPGDQIAFLEQSDVGGQPWFRIKITKVADNRGGPGVAVGSEGWASATLLSALTPVATP